VSQAGLLRENILEREGAGGKCTTNLAEFSIYLLLRVQSSSNESSSDKMYFRDFMQRELFVIKSSHTRTHTQRSLTYERVTPKKMEDTFYNTELKNKIKKSKRGKKKLTTVEQEQYINERKEHCRASVRVMSVLCFVCKCP